MNTRAISIDARDGATETTKPSMLDRMARSLVLSRLEGLENGQIVITEQDEQWSFGQLTEDFPQGVHLHVKNPTFYSDIAFGGSIGAGEAYINGYWSSGELRELLRILIRNRDVLEKVDSGLARLGRPLQKMLHALNRNTRKGSRKNIAAHYDLGNDFYSLWLDPTMMYSSAYFETRETPLEDAAIEKLDRICRKLELSAGDSVMEIGTGWGGFAIHAATHYGCHVTTTTISQQQYDLREKGNRRRRSRRQDHAAVQGLPRSGGAFRQAGFHRDDRGGRARVPRCVLQEVLRPSQARRANAAAGDYDRRPALR